MDFLHIQADENAWISGCCVCSQVVAFATTEPELAAAERNHRCKEVRRMKKPQLRCSVDMQARQGAVANTA